ncbi:maleate isomerase [Mesorhizobium robiniae]|uniref:Maleate isomerase n=1 Tax=Mesorhizobium robiniae TaxID=559315 RepID=A0ABV2GXN0_9HYPH
MNNPRIGIIYPSNGIYDLEFINFAPREASLHITRWRWPERDWSRPDAPDIMAELSNDPEIAACASLFDQIEPAVVTLGCTSVSFAAGARGDVPVLENIRRGTAAKPSSTSTGFLAACEALAADRIAVASVYHESLTRRFVNFLEHGGRRVVSRKSENWAREPSRMTSEDLFDLAAMSDHPTAQAILLPETNIHTSEAIPVIERRLKKPVLTAVQVTVWHAVRLAGSDWKGGIGAVWQAG